MRHTKFWSSVAASALALGAIAVGVVFTPDRGSQPTGQTTTVDQAGHEFRAANGSTPPLSQKTLARLRATGLEVKPAVSRSASAVAQSDAATVAERNFPGVLADSAPAQAGRALVTDPTAGHEQQPDPSKASQISPKIDNRSVWVLIYSDVKIPVFGPYEPGAKNEDKGNSYYTSDVAVLIDATTGEFLESESL